MTLFKSNQTRSTRLKWSSFGLFVVTTLTIGDIAQASDFGAYGQSNFENDWAPSLPYAWTQVVKFERRMGDYANSDWGNVVRDLHGAKFFFEGGCLRLFMSYSCDGLNNDDNNIHWRWDNIVKGGLQVTTGSAELM